MKISLLEQDEFRWLPRWHVAYTRNADIATTPVCRTTGTYRDGGEFGARVAEIEGGEKWCPDDEKEIVQMARDGNESETNGNKDAEIIRAHNLSKRKPGRLRKVKEAQ